MQKISFTDLLKGEQKITIIAWIQIISLRTIRTSLWCILTHLSQYCNEAFYAYLVLRDFSGDIVIYLDVDVTIYTHTNMFIKNFYKFITNKLNKILQMEYFELFAACILWISIKLLHLIFTEDLFFCYFWNVCPLMENRNSLLPIVKGLLEAILRIQVQEEMCPTHTVIIR